MSIGLYKEPLIAQEIN